MAFSLAMPPSRTLLSRWVLTGVLAPERVMPLIGIALLFGLTGRRAHGAGIALFLVGMAAGFTWHVALLTRLSALPNVEMHAFLTAPLLCILIGPALILSKPAGAIASLTVALPAGVLAALSIKATDPSFHSPTFAEVGALVTVWLVVALSLTVRIVRGRWLAIGAPIFGSWLIAVGVLYGGATLAQRPPRLPPEPVAPPSAPEAAGRPRFDKLFPEDDGKTQDILRWGLKPGSEP